MWSSHWKAWLRGLRGCVLCEGGPGVWAGPGELRHQICAKGGSNGAFLGEDLGPEQPGQGPEHQSPRVSLDGPLFGWDILIWDTVGVERVDIIS